MWESVKGGGSEFWGPGSTEQGESRCPGVRAEKHPRSFLCSRSPQFEEEVESLLGFTDHDAVL